MSLTDQEIKRAQARLAVVEHLLANLGSMYDLVATGTLTDPELLAVFTSVIADEKEDILALLTSLNDPGADAPIDQPAAIQGRLRIEQAKTVLGYLNRTLSALLAPAHTDEDGNTIADLTTEQRDALTTDLARAIAKLRQAVTEA
jgi:hypothetical protein